ncbi:MAG: DNA-binding protein HU-beta [Gammaproteobacteria bacterium]|jgi:DNA-binding protein HU-beta|nr:DNA-binding protein HU-beta [Gammaproteobacteria bacterium]
MNKTQLIDAIAQKAGIRKTDATKALNGLIEAVTKALRKGETVALVGFGSFVVRKRAARTGRNPKTGEPLKIDATRVPSFRAGKALKDAVRDAK